MKKTSRPDRLHETSSQSRRDGRKKKQEDRWAFNLASETLFALGSSESARRVAYRSSDGELRFLPL